MKNIYLYTVAILSCVSSIAAAGEIKPKVLPAPNGIEFPIGYQNWRVLSISHRIDNNTLRTILGNDIAIKAAKRGETMPWPKGAIIAKISWKQRIDDNWPAAIVPGEFHQLEIMIKDSKKYIKTQGWGYARWRGADLKPWGDSADFDQSCVACHTPVKNKDYIYSSPVIFITE